ncbi:MAG: cytochrome b N-terminal domain-containing protein [Chloroflexi bacterium]|nr:cytochrome b N-terminal domain-containing protein [Chloroflexota bacterium]OJW04405.1 MAG: cytochrome B6 [Chloroflexi bacterium 54-19]
MAVIKGILGWLEDRTGVMAAIKPVLDHKVPYTNWKTGWWYVLGSAVLVAFMIQVISGIALSTSYVSSAGDAYNSLTFITEEMTFGSFLRGMHFWGGSAMVLLVGAHALHVFIIGAFKFPREVNWLSGVVLFFCTLGMGFTGQLLRWDQTAFWSVIVGADQAARTPFIGESLAKFVMAGNTVGGATLSRFFAYHVFFIPGIIFLFIGLHLFLVIRNGISEPPQRGEAVDPKTYRKRYHDMLEKSGVPFWPDAVWRDAVAAIILVLIVVALAIFLGPPALEAPPDPTQLAVYPRPDWYLLWYFSVLALIPPASEPYVILGGPGLAVVLMLILPLVANKGERSPLRRPWAMGFVLFLVIMISTLWITGLVSPWSPNTKTQPISPTLFQASSAQVQKGVQLFYEKGCQYCHAIDINQNPQSGSVAETAVGGQRGPNLSTVGSRLTHEQLVVRILNGGEAMPRFGDLLKPDELDAIVAFLQTRTVSSDSKEGQGNGVEVSLNGQK